MRIATQWRLAIFHYLEVGTLKEREYTGISHVTSAFAEKMLEADPSRNHFFFGRTMVDREVVADLLKTRNGDLLEWHTARRIGRPAPFAAPGPHAAIFPNRKTCRRGFDFEVQIIHDLSTLLTPQYHGKDTIDFHANSMAADIASNDLTVCVSDATRSDVLRYLSPKDPTSVVTIYNAASPPASSLGEAAQDERSDRPYIVILGTIEPRKNVGQVLELLRDSPSFADRFQFIFLGRYGWGSSIESLVADYGLQSRLARGSIVFPGFVSEARKNALLRNAHLLIYPSLFEGYGLPIVEAMGVGVPCVTTYSSSMPEVGGDACFYFDPFRPGDFRAVFIEALMKIEHEGFAVRERCKRQASTFSWQTSYDKLLAEIAIRTSKRELAS